MRSGNNNSYDFHCGNDSRFVRIAVKSNIFHTLRIQAEAARSINLTGGTRKVEEILITKCFKLTRIHWPKYTGSITRLRIYLAESITKLDLSGLALEGLLELSIIDCAKLTKITGLPATLKWLNVHGANIDSLDVSHCQQLEVYNISTLSPTFTANLSHLPSLQSASIETSAEKTDESNVTCQINDCAALRLLNINTGNISANINLKANPNLTRAAISCGHRSELHGLSACAKLEFFHSDRPDSIKMDDASRRTAKQHSATSPTHPDSITAKDEMTDIKDTFTKFSNPILYPEPGPDDDETIIQLHGSPRERNHACMVRINLLSLPLEPLEERFSQAFNKRARRPIESLPNYLGGMAAYIYFLDKTVPQTELNELRQSAVIPSQQADTLLAWLENTKTHQPNTLMITNENLKMPSMIEFIESYRPDKRLVVYKNKYYRLTPMHKIVAEKSTKKIINNILAMRPHPVAAIMKNALAIQQNISAALGALPPALSAPQLQAQVRGFANQLSQTYNHYVNALVSAPTNQPATSNMRVTPAKSLDWYDRPEEVGIVGGGDENNEQYSEPAKPSAIRKMLTPDQGSGKNKKPIQEKSDAQHQGPIPDLPGHDKINPMTEDESPYDLATLHSDDDNDTNSPQARQNSDAKIQTIEKSDDRPKKGSVITNDNDLLASFKEKEKEKAKTSVDDDSDHWKSRAIKKKPIPDLPGHDQIEPVSESQTPDEWATLHSDDNHKKPLPSARIHSDANNQTIKNDDPDHWKTHAQKRNPIPDLPGHDQIEPVEDEESVPHARLPSEATSKLIEKSSGRTPQQGVISGKNKDDIIHAAKAKTAATTKIALPIPQHFSPEELPKPQYGVLEPSQDQLDKLLNSAKAKAEANQHKILYENLPAGQHGTLTENKDKPDEYESVRVKTEATGKPASAARLLEASKQLAESIQQMANIAKSILSVDDEHYDHLDDTSELINDSVKTLATATSVSADMTDETALRESLEAANQLANAMKRLNAACGHLQAAVKNTELLTPQPKPQPAARATRVKSADGTAAARISLTQALSEIKDEFIQRYRAKKLNEGLFGTGFQAGINNMRLEFLNTLIHALKNNQPLPDKDVNNYLKDIMGNPLLKKALAPHEADLRKFLTGPVKTLTSKPPRKLNE